MKVAVIGLGEFGKSLVLDLARGGAEVIAVDIDMAAVEDVRDEATLAVRLDGTDEKDLRAQGIEKVDALVVAMGHAFERAIMVTVAAKRLGIRRIVARAMNDAHARVLQAVGADMVVVPLRDAAESLTRRILTPSIRNYFDLADGVSIVEVAVPARFHQKKLRELDLRGRHRLNVVAIRRMERDGAKVVERVNPIPGGDEEILEGDVVAIAGYDRDVAEFTRLASG